MVEGEIKYLLGRLKATHHLHNHVLTLGFQISDCGKQLGLSFCFPVCSFLFPLVIFFSLFPVYNEIIPDIWPLSILWLHSHLSGLSNCCWSIKLKFLLHKNYGWYWSLSVLRFHMISHWISYCLIVYFCHFSPQLVICFLKRVSFFNTLYIYVEYSTVCGFFLEGILDVLLEAYSQSSESQNDFLKFQFEQLSAISIKCNDNRFKI